MGNGDGVERAVDGKETPPVAVEGVKGRSTKSGEAHAERGSENLANRLVVSGGLATCLTSKCRNLSCAGGRVATGGCGGKSSTLPEAARATCGWLSPASSSSVSWCTPGPWNADPGMVWSAAKSSGRRSWKPRDALGTRTPAAAAKAASSSGASKGNCCLNQS